MGIEAESAAAPPQAERSVLRETWSSLASVFANHALRRIQLALAGSMVGDWAYATAVVVWAYGVGGAKLVGLWGAVRLVLMAFATPVGSMLGDRLPRKAVLIGSDLTRAALIAVNTLCLVAGAPALVVLVVATVTSIVGCVFRPAQMAWMPSLTNRPEELTASNGASSTIESLAFFVGPALGGLLVATTNVETVFVLNGLTFLWSAFMVWGIHPKVPDIHEGDDGEAPPRQHILKEMASGFTHIARDRDLVMIAVIACVQTIVAGATVVLGVVFAVEILGRPPAAVGVIDSAFGVGAIVGGFVAIGRAARNRLAADMALGTLLWSLPLLLVVVWPSPVTVFAAVILLGFGNPLVDVNFATIVQRIAPDAVLGRVFGAYQGAFIGTMALGAAVTPFLIEKLGLGWTLTVLALVVGLPTIAFLPRCARLDATLRPPENTELLRSIAIFAPLPLSSVEALARSLVSQSAVAGETIVREGEGSDRFFVIASGGVEVTQDGRHLRHEGPGDFFGEIGLLRDVPRTATVTAVEDTRLLSLARDEFLEAVRGTDESFSAANDVVVRRLG